MAKSIGINRNRDQPNASRAPDGIWMLRRHQRSCRRQFLRHPGNRNRLYLTRGCASNFNLACPARLFLDVFVRSQPPTKCPRVVPSGACQRNAKKVKRSGRPQPKRPNMEIARQSMAVSGRRDRFRPRPTKTSSNCSPCVCSLRIKQHNSSPPGSENTNVRRVFPSTPMLTTSATNPSESTRRR